MKYVVVVYLIILSIWDIRKRKVPVIGISLFTTIIIVHGFFCSDLSDLLLGSAPGIGLCILARVVPRSLGMGDGLVLIGYGMIMGWKITCLYILLGMTLAAMVGIILRIWKSNQKELPFIPFLTAVHLGGILI